MFNKRGFTLTELLVAVSIIALISAVGITSFSQSQARARDSRRKSDLRSIAVALELYYQKNKNYPCNTSGSVYQYSYPAGNDWIKDSCSTLTPIPGLSPTYIGQVPIDPLNTGTTPQNGTNYSYAYFGENFGSCKRGQNYILIALLENANDPDSYGKKQNAPCGVAYSGWAISDQSFVLSN